LPISGLAVTPGSANRAASHRFDSCAATPSMICAGTNPPPLSVSPGNRPCGVYAGMPRFFQFAGRLTVSTLRTAWSTAHSTCRGLGCSAWLAGSLRGTEQYRSARSAGLCGSPAAIAPPGRVVLSAGLRCRPAADTCCGWAAAAVGALKVTDFPVPTAVAVMRTGCGAVGSQLGADFGSGSAVCTEVSTSRPCVDGCAPTGAASSETPAGSGPPAGLPAPVTNTRPAFAATTSWPASGPALTVLTTPIGIAATPVRSFGTVVRRTSAWSAPCCSMNTTPPAASTASLNGTPTAGASTRRVPSAATRTSAPLSAATMPAGVGTAAVSCPGTSIFRLSPPVPAATWTSRVCCRSSPPSWVSTASSPVPQPGL
jgi:hypothetical protein